MVFNSKENFNSALPSIAVYIFAGYKPLPLFQSIYQGFAQFKGNYHAADRIANDIEESKKYSFEIEDKNEEKLNLYEGGSLILNNVSFSYNNQNKAVKNINLEIKQNTLNFIVGPSGSGKSTLLDLILVQFFQRKVKLILEKIN